MSDEPPNQIFSNEDFIQAVERLEPVGTNDIAAEVNCAHETARLRLEQLKENDAIEHKMIAGVSVWYTE